MWIKAVFSNIIDLFFLICHYFVLYSYSSKYGFEAQVQLLWRMAPEPILCFDGDGAGQRAAFRAVDTILPMLKPGISAQFAFLPDGLDPDDLVRAQGAAAFEGILARTKALFDEHHWMYEQAQQRIAQLEQQLRDLRTEVEKWQRRAQDWRRANGDQPWPE